MKCCKALLRMVLTALCSHTKVLLRDSFCWPRKTAGSYARYYVDWELSR